MTDLFEGYAQASRAGGAFDEMFTPTGQVRPSSAALHARLAGTGVGELRMRADALARVHHAPGAMGQAPGPTQVGTGRELVLDLVPSVVTAQEWAVVERGLVQRVLALEAFLADVHGRGRVFDDGVVPRAVITSSARFQRVVAGIEPPNGVRVHTASADLVRDSSGAFVVLADHVVAPSGVASVMAHRAAMARAVPETLAQLGVRPVSDYPQRLLAALRAAAPVGVGDPTVVVLTAGPTDPGHAEHALLAAAMGVHLVEGRDLVARAGRLRVLTTTGALPVHVLHRRVPDELLDPVHLRRDSAVGCAGLLTAARAGEVSIANAAGNGVADDALVHTYLPDLVRYYLAEAPALANARSWRLDDPVARAEALDRLDELVLTPVDAAGGRAVLVGPAASAAELAAARSAVLADPGAWVAQPVIPVSTSPTLVGHALAPRRVGLRTFAVNDGSSVWVLPGGLTRVALPEEAAVLSTSSGAGVKDTWVLDAAPAASGGRAGSGRRGAEGAAGAAWTLHGSPPDRGPGLVAARHVWLPRSPSAAEPAPC